MMKGLRPSCVYRAAMALFAMALTIFAATGPEADAAEPLPIFDAHLHYNWEPRPHVPLDKVLELFRQQQVSGILATSRPNDGTRALYEARSEALWVVPFIRPYRVRSDIQSWMNDTSIQDLIEGEYKRGIYAGIGEFHLTGRDAAAEGVKRTVDFAARHGLYLHAHADEAALEILFGHNPQARIIWAHTGFSTPPDQVEAYLKRHAGLWCELSYRSGITSGGKLTAEWRDLFERYPERFLLGSDTWIDQRWDSYAAIMAEYRGWLGQLPREVAEKIAHKNAETLFRR